MVITNVTSLQHGEPGAHVTDIQPVEAVVSQLLNQILSKVCHNMYGKFSVFLKHGASATSSNN